MPVAAGNPVGPGDAAGAILFVTSYGQIWEVISALNSSPWTAENFGADAGKAKSAREYLAHSTANGAVIALIAAYVSRTTWPLVGAGLGISYAWWIYQRALKRATQSESVGWGSGQDLGLKKAPWLGGSAYGSRVSHGRMAVRPRPDHLPEHRAEPSAAHPR